MQKRWRLLSARFCRYESGLHPDERCRHCHRGERDCIAGLWGVFDGTPGVSWLCTRCRDAAVRVLTDTAWGVAA